MSLKKYLVKLADLPSSGSKRGKPSLVNREHRIAAYSGFVEALLTDGEDGLQIDELETTFVDVEAFGLTVPTANWNDDAISKPQTKGNAVASSFMRADESGNTWVLPGTRWIVKVRGKYPELRFVLGVKVLRRAELTSFLNAEKERRANKNAEKAKAKDRQK
jgi:hypothetical protein